MHWNKYKGDWKVRVMPSAPPFEKGVVGGVPLGHLAMKSGLAHKRIGTYRLTFLFKGLIPFGFPFQGYRFWLVFQRRDHHQQSRAKKQKQRETTGMGVPGGGHLENHMRQCQKSS